MGGGLAGSLTALALCRRADVEVMLLEQDQSFGGNHIWSFFDTDIAPEHRWAVEELVERRWRDHDVRFPRRSRTISIGYNSLSSSGLDAAVKSALRPDRYRLGTTVRHASPTEVVLGNGEQLEADAVIDARGGGPADGLELNWQKFVGRLYDFPAGHGISRPVIMDATIEQHDGYRFLYFLPLGASRLLIEDTYYSSLASLDLPLLETRIDCAATLVGRGRFELAGQESGVLPVVLGGDFDRFWPAGDKLPRLGVRGGFFHPTTSYSLPDAVANAALLAEQTDFQPEALALLLRSRAQQLWNDRGFYRLLNRMLFNAAEPDRAYKVLEHFYRLPREVIARFYAGRLTALDKIRILSGRPPVPLGRALLAMMGTSA